MVCSIIQKTSRPWTCFLVRQIPQYFFIMTRGYKDMYVCLFGKETGSRLSFVHHFCFLAVITLLSIFLCSKPLQAITPLFYRFPLSLKHHPTVYCTGEDDCCRSTSPAVWTVIWGAAASRANRAGAMQGKSPPCCAAGAQPNCEEEDMWDGGRNGSGLHWWVILLTRQTRSAYYAEVLLIRQRGVMLTCTYTHNIHARTHAHTHMHTV